MRKSSVKLLGVLLLGLVFVGAGYYLYSKARGGMSAFVPTKTMSYQGNIIKETEENTNFRKVLFTGPNSQLVVMSIPPGGEVGEETHKYTEQTLFFLSGSGEGTLDNVKFPVGPGSVVVVTAGTKHNFRNTGTENLKIYTVYAPRNHIDGLVEATKADADANVADEAIGETPPAK